MRAEEIALRLRKVLRQALRSVSVKIRERRRECGDRNAAKESEGDELPPLSLPLSCEAFPNDLCRLRVTGKHLLPLAEDARADDASAAPKARDLTEGQSPLLVVARYREQLKTLRVGIEHREFVGRTHALSEIGGRRLVDGRESLCTLHDAKFLRAA